MNWKEQFGTEWDYLIRIGSSIIDPEEKKAFWETVKAKKLDDPAYSIYTDFPLDLSTKTVDKLHNSIEHEKRNKFKESPSGKIAAETIEMLKGRGVKGGSA